MTHFDSRRLMTEALDHAQELLDLAIVSKDRGEREFLERLIELYIQIAKE